MIVIGFTGTRKNLTDKQLSWVWEMLSIPNVYAVHHGGCVGGDLAAHQAALDNEVPNIHVHPPLNKRLYAAECHKRGMPGVVHWEAKNFIQRNMDVVDCSDILLATPRGYVEELRSGTWSTVRYARKISKPIYICYPDGIVKPENVKPGKVAFDL